MFCLKLQKSKEHITFEKIISCHLDMIFEQRRKKCAQKYASFINLKQ